MDDVQQESPDEGPYEKLARLGAILDALPLLVCSLDAGLRYRFHNKAYADWFGCPHTDLTGRHVREIIGEAAYELSRPHLEAALSGKTVTLETDVPYAKIGTRTVHVSLFPDRGSGGTVAGIVNILSDVTERRQIEDALRATAARLEAQATTDGLTGLKNQRAFRDRLAEEHRRVTRYGTPCSLILLDVDHFKAFNDAFGHPAGDDVLRRIATLLDEASRETDFVARHGGEEFALLLPQTDATEALGFAERLRRIIETAPWERRPVTASFGVAAFAPVMSDDAALLFSCADRALYRSKQGGRNQVTLGGDHPAVSVKQLRLL